MREIKFRAWINEKDKEYSRMVHSEQSIVTILGHKYGGKGVAKPAGFSDIDNQPKPERYVLMQYTGLKDKNGREIYEGDILKGLCPLRNEWVGNVKYLAPYYAILGKRSHLMLENFNDMRVIGNIYENPELLGVEK